MSRTIKVLDAIKEELATEAILDVAAELKSACEKFPPFNSSHEGYAIIKEELDELWEEIRKQPGMRSKSEMLNEAKQVAAMAVRFMVEICS
jgi:hypothetical protein